MCIGIEGGQALVVPHPYIASENIGNHLARKVEFAYSLKIIGKNHCTHTGGDMKHLGHIGHLLVREESIASGKVNDLVPQVAHTATRTYASVCHGIAIEQGKLLEDHIIERQRKGSTCTGKFLCLTSLGGGVASA